MANLQSKNIDFIAFGDPKNGYVESAMLNGRYIYNPLAYDNTKSTINLYISEVNNPIIMPKGNFILSSQLPSTKVWYDEYNDTVQRATILNTKLLNDIYNYYDTPHYENSGNLVKSDNTIVIPQLYHNVVRFFKSSSSTSDKIIRTFNKSSTIYSEDKFTLFSDYDNPSSKYSSMIITFKIFIETNLDTEKWGNEYRSEIINILPDNVDKFFPSSGTENHTTIFKFYASNVDDSYIKIEKFNDGGNIRFIFYNMTEVNSRFENTYTYTIKPGGSSNNKIFYFVFDTVGAEFLKTMYNDQNFTLKFGISSLEINFE